MRAGVAQAASAAAGGASTAILDGLVLIVSELATNALRHGGGTATVRLGVDDASYLLEVVDHAPERPPHVAADRDAGDGGFGLVLALGVAREVGWYRTESSKVVWSVHDAPASP